MGIKQSRQILQNQHSNNSKVQHTGDTTTSHSTSSVIVDGRAYHNVEKSTYILPRDELEQDRLNSVRLFYFIFIIIFVAIIFLSHHFSYIQMIYSNIFL
jgi:hypothetical protein